jgi:hypothetical protein
MRKIGIPERYPHLRLKDSHRSVFAEEWDIHITDCGDTASPGDDED